MFSLVYLAIIEVFRAKHELGSSRDIYLQHFASFGNLSPLALLALVLGAKEIAGSFADWARCHRLSQHRADPGQHFLEA